MEAEQMMACLLAERRNASKAGSHDTEQGKNECQTKGGMGPTRTTERRNAGQNRRRLTKYDGQDGDFNAKALIVYSGQKNPC
jgi:hypothetical protein